MIEESFIASYIASTFENVETAVNLGYTFFIYRDDHMHAFATLRPRAMSMSGFQTLTVQAFFV